MSSKLFVGKSLKSQKDENFVERKKSENYFCIYVSEHCASFGTIQFFGHFQRKKVCMLLSKQGRLFYILMQNNASNLFNKGCMMYHRLNQLQEIKYQSGSVLKIIEQLYRIVDKMDTIVENICFY